MIGLPDKQKNIDFVRKRSYLCFVFDFNLKETSGRWVRDIKVTASRLPRAEVKKITEWRNYTRTSSKWPKRGYYAREVSGSCIGVAKRMRHDCNRTREDRKWYAG